MNIVLVTGGCGFIGSHFVRRLLTTDPTVQVINLDKLTYAGNVANLADVAGNSRYRLVVDDVANREAVRRQVGAGVDTIVHFAAESHVDRSIHDAAPFVRTNIVGTQVLLDAAREFGVSRFVQVSTDEVYGSLGPAGLFTEDTPLAPNSPYSASKAAADLLVRSYVHTYGVPAIITRCSNNYGPYQFPEKMIPLFIANLLRDEPVPIYGDGLQVRDWIHVTDHCEAIEQVARHGRAGEVYNIGGQTERTNLQVARALLDALGKPASLLRHVPDRPGHDRRYALKCEKIRKLAGSRWRGTSRIGSGWNVEFKSDPQISQITQMRKRLEANSYLRNLRNLRINTFFARLHP